MREIWRVVDFIKSHGGSMQRNWRRLNVSWRLPLSILDRKLLTCIGQDAPEVVAENQSMQLWMGGTNWLHNFKSRNSFQISWRIRTGCHSLATRFFPLWQPPSLYWKLQWCYYNDMHSPQPDFSPNCMFLQATSWSTVIPETVLLIQLFQEFRTKSLSVRPVLFCMNPSHTSLCMCKPQLMFGRSSGVIYCCVYAPFHPPWFQQIRYSLTAMAGVL